MSRIHQELRENIHLEEKTIKQIGASQRNIKMFSKYKLYERYATLSLTLEFIMSSALDTHLRLFTELRDYELLAIVTCKNDNDEKHRSIHCLRRRRMSHESTVNRNKRRRVTRTDW